MSPYLPLIVKHFRNARGLTQEQVGEAIHVSGSLIAMIESGRRIPQPDTAKALDTLFDTGELFARIAAEARKDHQPDWFRPFGDLEQEAVTLRTYEPLYVPGLLQTEKYATAVLSTSVVEAGRTEELLAVRLDRQATVLDGPRPPQVTYVIDEAALLRGDPDMMKEQILHMVDVGERPQVSLHLVPIRAGIYAGQSGAFTLASLGDGADVAFLEDQVAGRLVADHQKIAELVRVWEKIRSVALPMDLTRDALLRMVDEHGR